MLELLDQQKSLTINQWKIFVASVFTIMLDFFDFGLIGFTLAFFVSDWHLTFGQSAAILFSSGIASVPAGIFFGWLGDRIGRRKVFMITILTFSLATGLMAVTPERGWIFLVAMRFIVGLGVAGLPAVDMPLLQEYLPASKRGWVSGLSISLIPAGGVLAGILSAYLGTIIGWRDLSDRDRRTGFWLVDLRCARAARGRNHAFPRGGANRLARGLSAQRLSRYCVSIL